MHHPPFVIGIAHTNAIGLLERTAGLEAVLRRHPQVEGCGHIHPAEMRDIDGAPYATEGEWMESLTALVEQADGRLEIIDWDRHESALAVSPSELALTLVA
jgi:hypothetical protein